MPKSLGPTRRRFEGDCERATRKIGRAETAFARGGAGASEQVQDQYEMAFLLAYDGWLQFLEDSLARLMCGYPCGTPVVLRQPQLATIAQATARILADERRPVIYWYEANVVAARIGRYLDNSHIEQALIRETPSLDAYRSVRHRIGHPHSQPLRAAFALTTISLAGRTFTRDSAGRFLRALNPNVAPAERWAETIIANLRSLAVELAL